MLVALGLFFIGGPAHSSEGLNLLYTVALYFGLPLLIAYLLFLATYVFRVRRSIQPFRLCRQKRAVNP